MKYVIMNEEVFVEEYEKGCFVKAQFAFISSGNMGLKKEESEEKR